MPSYPGPIRDWPLPVLLHNTNYATRGNPVDGIADAAGLRAWVEAIRPHLPFAVPRPDASRLEDFHSLRHAVRTALHAVLDERAIPKAAVAELNGRSAAAARFEQLSRTQGQASVRMAYRAATPTDLLLGHLAAATIQLVSGHEAAKLHACGAPGCVLVFMKGDPRREWCSTACGNRARQARHYARTHAH
jgi:predicted RNA-binding Zn ribbon-like protein